MKMIIGKTSWLLFAFLMSLVFSSFTIESPKLSNDPQMLWKNEFNKVDGYVVMMIRDPIRKTLRKAEIQKSFSQCTRGYVTEFVPGKPIKTNCFVLGTIYYYGGSCPAEHICDFKVFVDKNYAVVWSTESDEYVTVNEWLQDIE
jgi:hypothetical protein